MWCIFVSLKLKTDCDWLVEKDGAYVHENNTGKLVLMYIKKTVIFVVYFTFDTAEITSPVAHILMQNLHLNYAIVHNNIEETDS